MTLTARSLMPTQMSSRTTFRWWYITAGACSASSRMTRAPAWRWLSPFGPGTLIRSIAGFANSRSKTCGWPERANSKGKIVRYNLNQGKLPRVHPPKACLYNWYTLYRHSASRNEILYTHFLFHPIFIHSNFHTLHLKNFKPNFSYTLSISNTMGQI